MATRPPAAFDAVLDGAVLQSAAVTAAKDGGTFVTLPSASPATPERDVEISVVAVESDGARLAGLLDLAAAGVLELRVAGRVPLTGAGSAYEKVAGGGQRGRRFVIPPAT